MFSPLMALEQTSERNSRCLVRCLCKTFSLTPRGCRACRMAVSSAGSFTHHQPRTISAETTSTMSPLRLHILPNL